MVTLNKWKSGKVEKWKNEWKVQLPERLVMEAGV